MRRCLSGMLIALAFLTATASASAATHYFILARGTTNSHDWQLRVYHRHTAQPHSRSLCISVWTRATPGQPLEAGGGPCFGERAVIGPHGVRYLFDLNGVVFPMIGGYNLFPPAMRVTVALADPRARRVKWRLEDGEVLRARTHPIPRSVGLRGTFAFVPQGLTDSQDRHGAWYERSAVAYDARGRVIARWG